MSISAREPRGTSIGGRFAARHHAEAPVSIYNSFSLLDPRHIDMAREAVADAWLYGNDSTESALDAIDAACDRRRMERPSRLAVLFSSDLSDLVQNQWPVDEPNEVDPYSDRIGNVGPTWKGVGFSPAEATRWVNAGVPDPAIARRLTDAGVTTADARQIYSDDDGHPVTVGEACSAGIISPEQAGGEPSTLPDDDLDDAVGF